MSSPDDRFFYEFTRTVDAAGPGLKTEAAALDDRARAVTVAPDYAGA